MTVDKSQIPSFEYMLCPTIRALEALGGSAYIDELDEMATELMDIPPQLQNIPHTDTGSDRRTEVEYRLAWARTYLKQFGLVDNPERKLWQLTDAYSGNIQEISPSLIVKTVRQKRIEKFKETEADLGPAETAEAFERFVLSALQDYASSTGKPIELNQSSDNQFDAIMPRGLLDNDQKTYIEIKTSCKEILRRPEYMLSRFAGIPAEDQILIIVGDTLSNAEKQKFLKTVPQLNVCIWDYNDLVALTATTTNEQDYARYLETPQKALVEDALRRIPNEQERQKIIEIRIQQLKEQYRAQNVTLFLGAGVSISASIPLWSTLIHRMFIYMVYNQLGNEQLTAEERAAISRLAEHNQESTPLTQVRYISSALTTDEYFHIIRQSLYEKDVNIDTELLNTIATLSKPRYAHKGLKSIVTYNFDDLLERKLTEKEIEHKIIFREKDIPDPDTLNIYHVHGYFPHEETDAIDPNMKLIFSESDYHELYQNVYSWSNLTQLNAFRETTCLFVGCSLEDPNVRRLLDAYRHSCEEPRHFAILKRKVLKATEELQKLYPGRLQQYQQMDDNIRDNYFRSIGINVIWVDDYDEVPIILRQIMNQSN